MRKEEFKKAMEGVGWVAGGFGNLVTIRGNLDYRCQLRSKGYRVEVEDILNEGKWEHVSSGRYSTITTQRARNLI